MRREWTNVRMRRDVSWTTTCISLLGGAAPHSPSSCCSRRRQKWLPESFHQPCDPARQCFLSSQRKTGHRSPSCRTRWWHGFTTAPRGSGEHWWRSAHVAHTSRDCQKGSFWANPSRRRRAIGDRYSGWSQRPGQGFPGR